MRRRTYAIKVVRETAVSLAASRDVIFERRRYDEVLDNQVAVQRPDEVVRLTILGLSLAKALECLLDQRVVLSDSFGNPWHLSLSVGLFVSSYLR